MHQYIFGQDEVVAQFVAQLIPECRERGFGKCRAIGIADAEGNLLGGLVYRNWCPEVGTIEISGAAVPGTNWLSRRTIQIMYDYPFYQRRLPDGDQDHDGRQRDRAADHGRDRVHAALHRAAGRARSRRRGRHADARAVGASKYNVNRKRETAQPTAKAA